MKKNLTTHTNLLRFLLIGLFILIAINAFILVRQFVSFPIPETLAALRITKTGDTITARDLRKRLANKNFIFLNVHTPYEGEIEKTDGFIPFDQIVAQSNLLPKEKNAEIILYCKTGQMSGEALTTIRKLGYTNVRHLTGGMDAWKQSGGSTMDLSSLEEQVTPKEGIELPVSWGNIGPQLLSLGVLDLAKLKQIIQLTSEQETILTKGSNDKIKITSDNSQFIVDILWAVGLAQKSIVYTEGPMGKEEKDKVGNFASTGGWTLAKGPAINYLNKFDVIPLTDDQQKKVGDIAKNVYRPCCGNSTWFPDCNHGMAALAAIELMVSAGLDERTIYKNILALNSYWFRDTYLTTATYFARQEKSWNSLDPKMLLGEVYSSGRGASLVGQKVGPLPYKPQPQGGSCGA